MRALWWNRSRVGMLTRRQALLVSASFTAMAPTAIAQPRHPTQSKSSAGSRGKKDAGSGGSPADTPIDPVDTVARWAYVMDYNTGASLLEKNADVEMPPSSMTKLM